MKKALLVCMLLYAAPGVFGQVSIGVRGGFNASNIEFGGGAGETIGTGYMKPLYGWHADLMFNIPVAGRFYLQPYLRYIRKGATIRDQPWLKPDIPGLTVTWGSSMELDYLELPVNMVYKLPVGRGHLVGGVGPYVGYGLKGKYNYRLMRNGVEEAREVRKVRFSDSGGDASTIRMQPWEAGAHLSIGYEFFSTFTIAANCNIGLTDIDRGNDGRSRNQYLGLSMGFLLNREDY
ncbi:porin family protein [Chitinophaga pollutisoli]|uniref:Porin family protein n=1 Tax=Chitinophaga pollutisoli TaxID=3133966 RepID=A0ABZ2YHA2_9BACT